MVRPKLVSLLVGFTLMSFGGHLQAASFDCAKASTGPERMICEDPGLSAMDDRLATAYAAVSGRADDPAQLRAEQRRWLGERNRCSTPACLYTAYRGRIVELEGADAASRPSQSQPQSCRQSRGAAQAQVLVQRCIQVSPTTHPPCNDLNPCDMIIDEIERGCGMLSTAAPAFCRRPAQQHRGG